LSINKALSGPTKNFWRSRWAVHS